jgi:hypothetical protein
MKRDLDGVYFRVMRDGKGEDLCWTDLMWEERIEFSRKNNNEGWLIRMIQILNDTINQVVEACPGVGIRPVIFYEGQTVSKTWLRNSLFRLTADILIVAEEHNIRRESEED